MDVPAVLTSGDHGAVRRWRQQQALRQTWLKRPDLLTGRPLTDLERGILDFLGDYLRRHTYQPSIREIGAEFDIPSTKTVSEHLRTLEDKGWIRREGARSRGVRRALTDRERLRRCFVADRTRVDQVDVEVAGPHECTRQQGFERADVPDRDQDERRQREASLLVGAGAREEARAGSVEVYPPARGAGERETLGRLGRAADPRGVRCLVIEKSDALDTPSQSAASRVGRRALRCSREGGSGDVPGFLEQTRDRLLDMFGPGRGAGGGAGGETDDRTGEDRDTQSEDQPHAGAQTARRTRLSGHHSVSRISRRTQAVPSGCIARCRSTCALRPLESDRVARPRTSA